MLCNYINVMTGGEQYSLMYEKQASLLLALLHIYGCRAIVMLGCLDVVWECKLKVR